MSDRADVFTWAFVSFVAVVLAFGVGIWLGHSLAWSDAQYEICPVAFQHAKTATDSLDILRHTECSIVEQNNMLTHGKFQTQ